MKTIEDAVIKFGGKLDPQTTTILTTSDGWCGCKSVAGWIVEAKESRGLFYHLNFSVSTYCNSATGWCVIGSREVFEETAKRMGYINGYEWGKEYPTNGKKPDLPDDLMVVVNSRNPGYWYEARPVCVNDWAKCKVFKITDPRHKPTEPEPAKPWFEAGELPAIGTVVELAEETEFLSLVTGEITLIAKGAHCHVVGHAKRQDSGNMCVTLMSVINVDAGFCTGNPEFLIKPIRTAREKAIDAACSTVKDDNQHLSGIFGKLYDAGLLRLPDNKKPD